MQAGAATVFLVGVLVMVSGMIGTIRLGFDQGQRVYRIGRSIAFVGAGLVMIAVAFDELSWLAVVLAASLATLGVWRLAAEVSSRQ